MSDAATAAKDAAAAALTAAQEKIKGLNEAAAKVLADAIRKTLQEPKLQENLKSRGYNVDLRTATAELNKLVKEEIEKYSRFSADELGWKAQ